MGMVLVRCPDHLKEITGLSSLSSFFLPAFWQSFGKGIGFEFCLWVARFCRHRPLASSPMISLGELLGGYGKVEAAFS